MTTENASVTTLQKQIKILIVVMIIGLTVSGLTAFPIEWQLSFASDYIRASEWNSQLANWLEFVYQGVRETNAKYPFISYGTDWLAFAHLVIAVAFVGPLRDPIRNIWVIEFGLIACLGIFPLAMIAGEIRGIPFYWRLLDCAFGISGGILLWTCHVKIRQLEIQAG